MAAMVARAKETLDSYDYALAYNYLERRVVEISGTLSEEQLAAKAALVGVVHAPGLAQRIATGACAPTAPYEANDDLAPQGYLWADGEIHAVEITPDLVTGAQLLPPAVAGSWVDLSSAEKAAAVALGLPEAAWPARFTAKPRAAKFDALTVNEQAAATALGSSPSPPSPAPSRAARQARARRRMRSWSGSPPSATAGFAAGSSWSRPTTRRAASTARSWTGRHGNPSLRCSERAAEACVGARVLCSSHSTHYALLTHLHTSVRIVFVIGVVVDHRGRVANAAVDPRALRRRRWHRALAVRLQRTL